MHINNGRYILANQCIYSNCFCWHCKTEFEAFKDIDLTVVFVEPESMIDMDFPLTENVVNIRKNNKSSGGNQYLNTRAKLRNTQTSQLACDSPIGLVYPNQSDTLQIEGENPSFRCQTPIKQRNEPVPPSFARQVLKATRQIQKPCGNTQPEFTRITLRHVEVKQAQEELLACKRQLLEFKVEEAARRVVEAEKAAEAEKALVQPANNWNHRGGFTSRRNSTTKPPLHPKSSNKTTVVSTSDPPQTTTVVSSSNPPQTTTVVSSSDPPQTTTVVSTSDLPQTTTTNRNHSPGRSRGYNGSRHPIPVRNYTPNTPQSNSNGSRSSSPRRGAKGSILPPPSKYN
jgi:hypothetical protein